MSDPRANPWEAIDDAVIAMAGVRARYRNHRPSGRTRDARHDLAVVAAVAESFCGPMEWEHQAFRKWIAARADILVGTRWTAVSRVAALLEEKSEVRASDVVSALDTTKAADDERAAQARRWLEPIQIGRGLPF